MRLDMGKAMRWIAVLPAIALVACSDEGAEAEKRYEMVKRTSTKGELCDAGREVADAYLRADNEEKYKHWHLISDIECQNAELTGRNLPAVESDANRRAEAEAEAVVQATDNAALSIKRTP